MKSSQPTAIILAGGLGTRLRPLISDLPKPMAPVNGKPFLHYIFQYLLRQNITDVILSVGYKHESIQSYFGSEYLGIKIRYSIEHEPLGTGGGIKQAFELIDNEAFVLNGDTYFDVNLAELRTFYVQSKSDLVLALKSLTHFDRYGTVRMDPHHRITEFCEKKFMPRGLINGGIYFFKKKLFEQLNTPDKFSFETDVLEKYSATLHFGGKVFDGFFIDIGIPEDYQKAQHEFK